VDDITEKVLQFQKSGEGFEDLVQVVSVLIYSLLGKRYRLDSDERSDFFCGFYPRIPLLFHRFSYRGKPFQNYLFATLKWHIRTFIAERRAKTRQRTFFEQECFWNSPFSPDTFTVHEDPPKLTPAAKEVLDIQGNVTIENPVLRKRLLLLLMKGSLQIENHIIQRFALLTGCNPSWVFGRIQQLKEAVLERSGRLNELRLKRNKYFVKIYTIHIEIAFEPYPWRRESLCRELEFYKSRMRQILQEIGRCSQSPTHTDIAAVMELPKGSVDSGIYYISNSFDTEQ
jgi:hypothetical protein